MQTRTELHPLALGVMACALMLRTNGGDERHLHRRMRRLAAVAERLPPGVFGMGLLRPLEPVTLRTIGRRTGGSHLVTLLVSPYRAGWVATTCMGGDPDWIKNLRHEPLGDLTSSDGTTPVHADFPFGAERADAAAAFADCENPVVTALARRLLAGSAAAPAQCVVLEPC